MADQFTANKFRWLEHVATVPGLAPTCYRVVIILSRHLNRKTGDAWPSVVGMATDLSVSEEAVRKALKTLKTAGCVDFESGGGNGVTNRYRPAFGLPKHPTSVGGKGVTSVGGKSAKHPTSVGGNSKDKHPTSVGKTPNERRAKHPTSVGATPLTETIEEPNEERSSLSSGDLEVLEDAPFEFEDLIRVYPVQPTEDLKWARRKFDRLIESGEVTAETLIRGAQQYGAHPREPQFTKQLQNWLDAKMWEAMDPSAVSRVSEPASMVDRVLAKYSEGV